MTPLVRVVGAREPEQLFISIEDIPLVLADLRRSLPELAAELRGKWQVETVYIEEQKPRAKNPIDPAQIIPAACIGLVVVFGSAVLKAAGTKIGDAIGDEIIGEPHPSEKSTGPQLGVLPFRRPQEKYSLFLRSSVYSVLE